MPSSDHQWPIFVQDRQGRTIYLTMERWEHVLDHPGMYEGLIDAVLLTIRTGRRKQDNLDPDKSKYSKPFDDLPLEYTHIVVVVKFSEESPQENNFVLTAYLVRKWT
ncbi:MAG: hypothetical protein QME81_09385 [bacterium]|nr:hypothetical protein [bacterium]